MNLDLFLEYGIRTIVLTPPFLLWGFYKLINRKEIFASTLLLSCLVGATGLFIAILPWYWQVIGIYFGFGVAFTFVSLVKGVERGAMWIFGICGPIALAFLYEVPIHFFSWSKSLDAFLIGVGLAASEIFAAIIFLYYARIHGWKVNDDWFIGLIWILIAGFGLVVYGQSFIREGLLAYRVLWGLLLLWILVKIPSRR